MRRRVEAGGGRAGVTVHLIGPKRRGLLATTALQTGAVLVLALPASLAGSGRAAAQPAPTARPAGGTVVGGQASIGQTTTQTTVAQASQRAAIDWRSYDIGSAHAVVYQQPNAQSITLNRVTGPDPSQIAGRISANGQVVIVNGSGVVFHAGAQVDVQSLVVSSANVSNQNFMAGKLIFDQPGKPDAKISNAGSITVKETGLAALVAPQVANSGVISAKLGHVVLAGAEAHTVDLYGDGLLSVDVTKQVTHTPSGGAALVTNSGTIAADGGTIVLTAQAADGIVTNLVTAGGKLRANTVGDKTGTIVVSAVGGNVTMEGVARANGREPGSIGGTVQVAASDTVKLAATARVSANGEAGGGTVAIGTTPARARAQGLPGTQVIPPGTARVVKVAAGAKIAADARAGGNGGTVALLSTDATTMNGAITARGGRRDGDGGRVEVSSAKSLGIAGTVDTSAPAGKVGTLLLDPTDLTISDTVPDNPSPSTADNSTVTTATQTISAAAFNGFQSNVNLLASGSINLNGSTPLQPGQPPRGGGAATPLNVTLTGGTIDINTPLTVASTRTLSLIGSTITVNSQVSAGTGTLVLQGSNVRQTATGTVIAGVLTTGTGAGAASGAIDLSTTPNNVSQLGPLSVTSGDFKLNNGNNALQIVDAVNVGRGTLSLMTGNLSQTPAGVVTAGTLTGSSSGNVNLTGSGNAIATLGAFSAASGDFSLTNSVALAVTPVAGTQVTARNVTLTTTGGTGSTVTLGGDIGVCDVGGLPQTGDLFITSSGAITVRAGTIGAQHSLTMTVPGSVTAPGVSVTGGTVNSPTVTIGLAGLDLSGGSVYGGSVTVTGPMSMSGGALSAKVLSPGSIQFSGGTLTVGGSALPTNLTVTVPHTSLSGSITTDGSLDVSGTNVTSRVTLLARGNVTITDGGSFTQTAGTIAAGGSITVNAADVVVQSDGLLAAGTGAVELFGAGAGTAAIAGMVSGTTVRVIEPFANLTFQPSLLGSAATFSPGTLPGAFSCPGCTTPNPPPPVIPTFTVTPGSGSPGAGSPSVVRLDGSSLQLSSAFNADSVELHSVSDTTQTASFTANSLSGTAGYAVTLGVVPPPLPPPSPASPYYDTPATAGSATLTAQNNAVREIGPYYTGGSLALTSTAALTVVNQLVAGANQAIALTAPSITIKDQLAFGTVAGGRFSSSSRGVLTVAGPATATAFPTVKLQADVLAINDVNADVRPIGGIAAIAPLTAGRPVTVDATAVTNGPTLSLGTADLAHVTALGGPSDTGPQTLRIGSLDGTTNLAGSVTINTNLPLTDRAATLDLRAMKLDPSASGDVTEVPGVGISIGRHGIGETNPKDGTIEGDAGGSVTLGTTALNGSLPVTPTNHFDILGPFRAGGSLSVADTVDANSGRSGLTVKAGATVSSGTGDLGMLSLGQSEGGARLGGTIAIAGTIDATGHVLTLNAIDGAATAPAIVASAGSVVKADTLKGEAHTADPSVVNNPNYNVLIKDGTAQVDTLARFIVGTHNPDDTVVSVQGAFRLADQTDLTITGQVTAKSVEISAPNIVARGPIGACDIGGGAGDVVITSPGRIVVQSGTIGGKASVDLAATGGVFVSGGLVNAPLVTLGASLGLSGGKVFGDAVTVSGPAFQTGGALFARDTLTTGGLTFSDGTLYAGNGLSFATNGPIGGSVSTPGSIQIIGGPISSTGTIIAGGDVAISADGDFAQAGGTIAAGGNLTVSAGGLVQQSVSGTMEAGGALSLSGSGPGSSAIDGQLAGRTITVNEPNAVVSFNPAVFTTGNDHPLGGAATVSLGTLGGSFDCPGCLPPGVAPAVSPSAAAPGSFRPETLTLTGGTLTLRADHLVIAADTIALTSTTGPTTQGGSLEANVLTGSARTDATLNNVRNDVAELHDYAVGGNLAFQDAPGAQGGLMITGTVATGNATITTTGAQGAQTIAGTLSGGKVGLVGSGPITGGAVIAGTLTANAPSVHLDGAIDSLGPSSATSGDFVLTDSAALLVAGPVTATAGTVAITDRADVTVAPLPSNAVATITAGAVQLAGADLVINGEIGACTIGGSGAVSLTATAAAGTISVNTGAVLGGQTSLALTAPGGVTVTDGLLNAPSVTFGDTATPTSLVLNGGTVFGDTVTVSGTASQTGGALFARDTLTTGGTSFNGGTLYAGNRLDLSVSGPLAGTVATPGDVAIGGGPIASTADIVAGGSIVVANTGDFAQNGGTIAAAGDVTVRAGGLIVQSGGAFEAGGTLLLRASGAGDAGIAGQLAGRTIEIVEPNATLSITPATFGGDHPLGSGATVRLGTVSGSFTCPGCAPAGVAPTLGAFAATPGVARPATLRIDGGTLALGPTPPPTVSSLTAAPILAADAVELHSVGDTTQSVGSLETATLTGTAGIIGSNDLLPVYAAGSATVPANVRLARTGNAISRIGPYTITGDANGEGLTVVDGTSLTVAGPVQTGGGSAFLSVIGGLDIQAPLTAGGPATLISTGAMSVASAVTGTEILATSHSSPMTIGGSVQATRGALTLDGFSLAVQGSVSSPGPVALDVVGATTLSGGSTISGGSVTGTSGGVASLGGSVRAASGPVHFTAGADLDLQGSVSSPSEVKLDVTGATTLASGSVVSGGSVTGTSGGAVTIGGFVLATSGPVALTAGRDLSLEGSVSSPGEVKLGVMGATTLGSGSAVTGASINALSTGPATLGGTESAARIVVTAPAITLAGNTIVTGAAGVARTTPVTALPDVGAGTSGAFLEAASTVTQTGVTTVQATAGSTNPTVRIDLTSQSGSISFANLSGPAADLILGIGNGSVTGAINVNSLALQRLGTSVVSPGTAELTGSVGGLTGTSAAGVSRITNQGREYRLNACAIGSVNCVVLQPQLVPVGNPLKELSLSFFRQGDEDEDLVLPNITDQGL